MKGIFLLLGTNLGDKAANLNTAIELLKQNEISVKAHSSIYESAPWGDENQGWFLNIVIQVETPLDPQTLLDICLQTEKKMGRKRIKKWGERIIDIDILYYHNLAINEGPLTVPHPGIAMRRFTLLPLSEIAPDEVHPILNMNQTQLLDICPDELECVKTDEIELAF